MIDILIAFALGQVFGVVMLIAVACFITWRWWKE